MKIILEKIMGESLYNEYSVCYTYDITRHSRRDIQCLVRNVSQESKNQLWNKGIILRHRHIYCLKAGFWMRAAIGRNRFQKKGHSQASVAQLLSTEPVIQESAVWLPGGAHAWVVDSPKEMKSVAQRDICTLMFIPALFITANTGKQPKYPSIYLSI